MSFFITLGAIIGITVLLIMIFNHFFGKTDIIYDKILNCKDHNKVVNQKDLPETNTSNFTMSIWFYINEWNHNFGQNKNIMYLANSPGAKDFISEDTIDNIDSSELQSITNTNYKNLNLYLGEYENNLHIQIETYTKGGNITSSGPTGSTLQTTSITEYVIPNIEVQKWVCLTISVDTRTMDVYLDGKLVNSYILPGVYKPSPNNNLYLGNTDNNSLNGFVTRFRYIKNDISPEHSYSIYKDGINSSTLGNMFNKYRLKVSFLEYDKDVKSFTI